LSKIPDSSSNFTIAEVARSITGSPSFRLCIIKSSKLFIKSYFNISFSAIVATLILYVINRFGIDISQNQIYRMNDLLGNINLAMFGVIITGYAIFQAFLSRTLSVRLLLKRSKKYSLFEEYNMNFFNTSLLFLLLIFAFILISIMENFSINFSLFNMSIVTKEIVKKVILFIYIFIEFIAILETKSIIFNIYQAFNVNALNILSEHKKDLDKKRDPNDT